MNALYSIERKPDGSLPRMTAHQRKHANHIIRSYCSNYDDGSCILLDESPCPQILTKSLICRFFRYVLLEDQKGLLFKAEIFKRDTLKICSVCGSKYQSVGNRAKYCETCKKHIHLKQKAESKRKRERKRTPPVADKASL